MKAEMIMDAIGYLDEELLLDYDHLDVTEKKKKYFVYIGWAAAAACLCLVITFAAFQLFGRNDGGGGTLAEKETQAPTRTEVPYSKETSRPTEPGQSEHPQTETPSPVTGSPAPLIVPDSRPQNPQTEGPGIQDRNPDSERIPQPAGTTGTQAPTTGAPATKAPEPKPQQTDQPSNATAQPTPKPDWESMWTTFIAMTRPEMGSGLDGYPTAGKPDNVENESKPTETPDELVSEEYFMQHSSWSFTLNYGSGLYVVRNGPLVDAEPDQPLGMMSLNIRETKVKHLNFTQMVQVYTVKGIAKEAALAIQIDPWNYYLVYNLSYQPKDMASFMQDLCLRKTVQMLGIEFPDAENPRYFSDNDKNWDVLYAYDGAALASFDEAYSHCCARIELTSSVYGFDGMTVSLYSDGYVKWQMLGRIFCFRTDPALAEQLMSLYENAY